MKTRRRNIQEVQETESRWIIRMLARGSQVTAKEMRYGYEDGPLFTSSRFATTSQKKRKFKKIKYQEKNLPLT
jgi:hypothetical protein